MTLKKRTKQATVCFLGFIFCFSSLKANNESNKSLTEEQQKGMDLFQGKKKFEMGGPSCITCHNVSANKMYPGGLYAKDLTDVYDRLGEGITGWLMAPPFPAMSASYGNKPLTETERVNLTAFFKYATENKDSQTNSNGYFLFFLGGGLGVIILLGVIQVLWFKRKKAMVKEDIFSRQQKAWDAKF